MGRGRAGGGGGSGEDPRRGDLARPPEGPPAGHRPGFHRHGARGGGLPARRPRGTDPGRDAAVPRARGLRAGADCGRGPGRAGVRKRVRCYAWNLAAPAVIPATAGVAARRVGAVVALLPGAHAAGPGEGPLPPLDGWEPWREREEGRGGRGRGRRRGEPRRGRWVRRWGGGARGGGG